MNDIAGKQQGGEVALLPCPFCAASDDGVAVRQVPHANGYWSVECDHCDCRGPSNDTQTGAIDEWNRQAADPRPAADVEREAAIQQMREALESAYCHTFNTHCIGKPGVQDEHEEVHEEILEACCAADRVGIKCGDQKPFEDAKVSRVAGIIQDGLNHEMGAVMIARAIVAALQKQP